MHEDERLQRLHALGMRDDVRDHVHARTPSCREDHARVDSLACVELVERRGDPRGERPLRNVNDVLRAAHGSGLISITKLTQSHVFFPR